MVKATDRIREKNVRVQAIVGGVTVLLLLIAALAAIGAEGSDSADVRVFDFTCEFDMPMGRARLNGLMASDGTRSRTATYWMEPVLFRESPFFLRYTDFLFTRNAVYYWIHPEPQAATFHFSMDVADSLLPQSSSVQSIVRSALAVVNCMESPREGEDTALEMGRFFRGSRRRVECTYEATPDEADANEPSSGGDVHVLNALPYGRRYSKEKQNDGSLVWRARKALTSEPVVSVTIRPVTDLGEAHRHAVFDADTLGRWPLIPEAFRAYWSFERAHWELGASPDARTSSRALYDQIESYLERGDAPAQVARALDRLRFKTAFLTDDADRVRRSAQASTAGLCRDDSVDAYEGLLELARIVAQVEKEYPQEANEWLRPLVGQIVKHTGPGIAGSLDKLMVTISANRWFTYGRMLLDEVGSQEFARGDAVKKLVAQLEAARIAASPEPPGPSDSRASVERYLAHIDAEPPRGTLDINDLRHTLEKGLAKVHAEPDSGTRHRLVQDVLRSIRLIVGEGPFCGDQEELIPSIERFSTLYCLINKINEPIDTVLATFLALSFCDTSTAKDHEVLCSQVHRVAVDLQRHLNTMVTDRGLGSLVTSDDVNAVFTHYERVFRRYVDDPLWPAFKFPFNANEEARLTNRLKACLGQMEPLLDDMCLKLKYGGASKELKSKMMYEVSRSAEQLLLEAASLRRPRYPGVSCQYRARYGFTAAIAGPLYEEGGRPKERFKAMKYFHLGHRLEEVVRRERELTQPSRTAPQEIETR